MPKQKTKDSFFNNSRLPACILEFPAFFAEKINLYLKNAGNSKIHAGKRELIKKETVTFLFRHIRMGWATQNSI